MEQLQQKVQQEVARRLERERRQVVRSFYWNLVEASRQGLTLDELTALASEYDETDDEWGNF